MDMQKLTRAEEELMQVLWQLEGGFLKEIMDAVPEPKPSQSTVSTILRILQDKGFVGHEAFGKSFRYHALVGREEYAQQFVGSFVERFFNGSYKKMLSFFIDKEEIDLSILDEMLRERKEDSDV